MFRVSIEERPRWRARAQEFGFEFHTIDGASYWDETAYYQFSLEQVESDIEAPTEELHQMCLEAVDRVIDSERWLDVFRIPTYARDWIRASWTQRDKSLYSRLDLCYDGINPAKLYENNADTPTSLYETGFWQWLWLEDQVNNGHLSRQVDQFNSVQEKLVNRFRELSFERPGEALHVSCCRDSKEDRGTVQYLQDCAEEAGIRTRFVYVDDIGLGEKGDFTDSKSQCIRWMFKLYPWEFMLREEYGAHLPQGRTQWLEPPWKAILSNKALLPMLWKLFPGHPNLLPAYFEGDSNAKALGRFVRKPLLSREGANIQIYVDGQLLDQTEGPYNDEGFIYQQYCPLPRFGDNHVLVGSWLIDDQPAGLSIREDDTAITQDTSRYLPHVITP
ncbi:glutathionylspermidine synthase family protein [Halomonas litopenaei]|uniref:glutathionylspermidine synthase family protein n=1 Tax=Halomonas litopenaei TaxID=2109328 RepID=UPI001A8D0870|nr:glutathionylspermidine synthase family protein [Halomonas litopenaei]MBN8413546.1 glutathionylspermidine synthase family protein [Halomonas litopenaei]